MNKKSIIIIVCAVMASASVTAQTAETQLSPKEQQAKQAADLKAQLKAEKAQKAADLKAFKAKQKADLAEFIENQKNPQSKTVTFTKPELKTDGDSIAYLMGAYQSNGLKQYMASQLAVDTALYMNQFCEGVMYRINNSSDDAAKAYLAGTQIGGQIENMAASLTKDFYAAEPDKKVDPAIVANSILAAINGQNEFTIEEAQTLFSTQLNAKKAANNEALYGPNREAGQKFLADNAKKDGVVVLPSGLQYKVLTEGKGAIPQATQKVKVNYEGRLVDGTVFDSSYKRGQPSTFAANQVIKGWTEALTHMPVGSKWELYIPYNLAYGEANTGDIKPYSALIFTVELLEIVEK